jgi:hypothetical protein
LVGTFVIDKAGAGYQSTSPFNLVASNDEWAAPIMAEVGPDGNVWVLDWYKFIVQHNPTPQGFSTGKGNAYESDLRDKKYGRVYRVVYNGKDGLDKAATEAADKSVLNGLDPSNEAALVAALKHPTMLWRKHAQRLLIEKGALSNATTQALRSLVSVDSVDSYGLYVGAIHALWILNATKPSKTVAFTNAQSGVKMENELTSAMKHKSPGVRLPPVDALLGIDHLQKEVRTELEFQGAGFRSLEVNLKSFPGSKDRGPAQDPVGTTHGCRGRQRSVGRKKSDQCPKRNVCRNPCAGGKGVGNNEQLSGLQFIEKSLHCGVRILIGLSIQNL